MRSNPITIQHNCINVPVEQPNPNALESSINAKRFSGFVAFVLKKYIFLCATPIQSYLCLCVVCM